jgi:hypothetical protein
MFRIVYLTLCTTCLFVKAIWILLPFLGEMHTCRYTNLLLSNLCQDFMAYLVMSIIFFYIDPLLMLTTLIWLIRTVNRMEKYPKENIFIALSWVITIGSFAYFGLIGYSG